MALLVLALALALPPRVLVIGDSISQGYYPHVRDVLAGEAEVVRIPGNGEHTGTGLARLDDWLGDGDWDVIHFNWGLWDLCYRGPDGRSRDAAGGTLTTPIEAYGRHLDTLVDRLAETGAALVWATTTPVPPGEPGRLAGDAARYNAVAEPVMRRHGVAIDDLHALAAPRMHELQVRPGDVHFTVEGSRLLAEQVATSIRTALAARAASPNIVLVVADDLGWTDFAFMGSDYHRTPHLDRLATEGMVFTHAYAGAANCAPSRAALLAGRYAPRTGVHTVGSADRGRAADRRLVTPPNRRRLAARQVTFAETLRAAGYETAFVGKWHLGEGEADGPLAQGFDHNVAGNLAGHPKSYLSPYGNPDLADGPAGEHLTARLTDEAIAFATRSRDRPFLLVLSYYAVHTPIQPDPGHLAAARARPPGAVHHRPRYAAMVEGLDAGVGRLLEALDDAGLRERTVVIFTSDNGGHGRLTSMDPLRGAKGMFHEGGIRVPLVVRWPGRVGAGTRCATPVAAVDMHPTLAAIAGADRPAAPLDGVNVVPLLEGRTIAARDLFWHFPAYLEGPRHGATPWRTTPCSVIRRGRYKLLEFFEDGRLELYDLETDPGETTNLADSRPALRDTLHAALAAWRANVGATMPRAKRDESRAARGTPPVSSLHQ